MSWKKEKHRKDIYLEFGMEKAIEDWIVAHPQSGISNISDFFIDSGKERLGWTGKPKVLGVATTQAQKPFQCAKCKRTVEAGHLQHYVINSGFWCSDCLMQDRTPEGRINRRMKMLEQEWDAKVLGDEVERLVHTVWTGRNLEEKEELHKRYLNLDSRIDRLIAAAATPEEREVWEQLKQDINELRQAKDENLLAWKRIDIDRLLREIKQKKEAEKKKAEVSV